MSHVSAASDPGDIAIRVSNVSKEFMLSEAGGSPVSLWGALKVGEPKLTQRKIEALHDVSFTVPSGQRLGIIGRNGAGKTTLLSILAGITEPTRGDVVVNGEVHALLTIGAVLREEASGRENIRLDGAVHGKTQKEIAEYEETVVAFSELGDFIDRPVRTYSSGMKARLAFSMGAFVKPDVLILDETLSVGDAFFSDKATRRMKEVAESGRVVILVSHGLRSIVEMCERCIWMDQGRIIMDGAPEEVTKAYEKMVKATDEADLAKKFGSEKIVEQYTDKAVLTGLRAVQDGQPVTGNARAMVPLALQIEGQVTAVNAPELTLTITRVDGRQIYKQSSADNGLVLPGQGPIALTIKFDPMILGADLYRFEVRLSDEGTVLDTMSVVCEMTDEEGQFGGVPLLLAPPDISVSPSQQDKS
tara:strand:- start:1238 stop:2488 length:1251 start_codon:yes stop_codon:yes gene_type:complete